MADELAALWRSVLPDDKEVRKARRRMHLKALFIIGLVGASYWALVIADLGLAVRMAAAVALVLGLVAVATGVMHDANHRAFSKRQWLNRIAGWSADGLGLSSTLWRFKHNVLHHGATNVEGVDSDIAQAPFARLAPGQPWRPWHRLQHVYLWPLYGFMAIKNLLIGDFKTLVGKNIGGQPLRNAPTTGVYVGVITGKLFHAGWALAVPFLFNPWTHVLAFYVGISWVVGFMLAVIFQLAHCVDRVSFAEESDAHRGRDFARHQLRTTSNVTSTFPVMGHLFRWLVGGLDHQIEHHIGPRLPHTALRAVGDRLRSGCAELGLSYQTHPGIVAAIRSHARWLKEMSRQPEPATKVEAVTEQFAEVGGSVADRS